MTKADYRCEFCGRLKSQSTRSTHCSPPFPVRAHKFSGQHPADIVGQHQRNAILDEAARAARTAQLPDDYIWSESNREKFAFGAERAAAAIEALRRERDRLEAAIRECATSGADTDTCTYKAMEARALNAEAERDEAVQKMSDAAGHMLAAEQKLVSAVEMVEAIADGDVPRPVENTGDVRCVHDEWLTVDCGGCMSIAARAFVASIKDPAHDR